MLVPGAVLIPNSASPPDVEVPSYATVLAEIEATETARALNQPALEATASVVVTSVPSSTSPPYPLPGALAVPTPVETRIETESLPRMEVGRSSVVSVRVLNVSIGEPTSTPEQSGASVFAERMPSFATPGPAAAAFGPQYIAFVTARLTGSAFDIVPAQQETEYRLLEEGIVSWDWSVTPKQPGLRDLIVTVDVEYRPLDDTPPIVYRVGRRRLNLEVYPILVEQGPPVQWMTLVVGGVSFALGILFTRAIERLIAGKSDGKGRAGK